MDDLIPTWQAWLASDDYKEAVEDLETEYLCHYRLSDEYQEAIKECFEQWRNDQGLSLRESPGPQEHDDEEDAEKFE